MGNRSHQEWAQAVRACRALSSTARLVAQSLALDWANRDTGQCNPKRSTLADHLGFSVDTIKRALAELEREGWLAKVAGRGRGVHSSFTFLTPGNVVRMPDPGTRTPAEIARSEPSTIAVKGRKPAPVYPIKKGANLRGKGGKSAPPLYNDRNQVRTKSVNLGGWKTHTFTGNRFPGPRLAREDNFEALRAWGNWLKERGHPHRRARAAGTGTGRRRGAQERQGAR